MYNLRPRVRINYNENALIQYEHDKLKKNKKDEQFQIILSKLDYKLKLHRQLTGEENVKNAIECIELGIQLVKNHDMPKEFIITIKNKIKEFLTHSAVEQNKNHKKTLEKYLKFL